MATTPVDPLARTAGTFPLNTQSGVTTIGSAADNDIVISDPAILPYHLMLDHRQAAMRVIALSPEADIRINGVRLSSESGAEVRDLSQLEFGGYNLQAVGGKDPSQPLSVTVSRASRIVQPPPAAPAPPPMGAPPRRAAASYPPARGATPAPVPEAPAYPPPGSEMQFLTHGEEVILVQITPGQQAVNVEIPASFQVSLVNAGPLVATFEVAVSGVPAEWVEISPPRVNLNEGGRATVNLRITPPRASSSRAGNYPLQVSVTSSNYPDSQGQASAELVVNPYYEWSMGQPSPRVQRASFNRRFGRVSVPIENQGNSRTDFMVFAQDEENGCQFEFPLEGQPARFKQTEISIEPDSTFEVPLRINPLKRSLVRLRAREYRYTVSTQQLGETGLTQTQPATFLSRPLLGPFSILAMILVLLGVAYLILRPHINSFALAEKVIRQGQTAVLRWDVSLFTTDLRIEGVNQPISGRKNFIEVTPQQAVEEYTLYASNFLYQMLGRPPLASQPQTVVIIPPSPQIATFFVDKTDILEGDEVTVKWSTSDSDAVFLTIEGVRTALAKEEFSGERVVKIKKDSLVILEAQNSSGTVTRSAFVSVKTTSIVIEEFTISKREIYVGEPVTITWKVSGIGVESVTIAPFSEALPLEGVLTFFPKESMEFVLTVTNRDLEEIRLLPVGVLPPGTPPTPPAINYFKAAPEEITGAGQVEFSWGVSGITDNIQISNITGVVADKLPAQGFKLLRVAQTTNYVLTAFNSTVSASAIVEVKVNPALKDVYIAITSVVPTIVNRGEPMSVYIDLKPFVDGVIITDTVAAGLPEMSGNVVVTDGFDTCDFDLPKKSCDLIMNRTGPKTLTATYGGDDHYVRRTSAPYTLPGEVVGLGVVFTGTVWSPTSVIVGEASQISFKLITADPNNVSPITGQVKVFSDQTHTTEMCPAVNLVPDTTTTNPADAMGSCQVIFTSAGQKSVDLSYGGNEVYDGKNQLAPPITVNTADTKVVIISTSPGTPVSGQSVTVNFRVEALPPGNGIPSGTVTITHDQNTSASKVCTLNSSGQGSCNLLLFKTVSGSGAETLTAQYNGDTSFKSSTSSPYNLVVNQASLTIAFSAISPDPAKVGETITTTLQVSVNPPGSAALSGFGSLAGKLVTIASTNLQSSCTVSLTATGVGSCQALPNHAGLAQINATFNGSTAFASATASRNLTVGKGDVSVAIDSDLPDPSDEGRPVVVMVHAEIPGLDPNILRPSGTIKVSGAGAECYVNNYPSQISCQITFTNVQIGMNTFPLLVEFLENADFNYASDNSTSHTVTFASQTTLSASPPSGTGEVGQAITFNFTVSKLSGSGPTPTGSVIVNASTGESCNGTLTSGSGHCTITFLNAGSRNITANYSGDVNYGSSASTPFAYTVIKSLTQTSITSLAASSVYGTSVPVGVQVTAPNYSAPNPPFSAGTVTVTSSGGASCVAAIAANGSGSCNLTFLSAGIKSVTAAYSGTAVFQGSTSSASQHTVDKATTTTTITSVTPQPLAVGQLATIQVQVGSNSPITPTGSIRVISNQSGIICASVPLTNGRANCTFTFSYPGSENLTSEYAGTANFQPSTSNPWTQQIDLVSTTLDISSVDQSPAEIGVPATVHFTLAYTAGPKTPAPGGSVVITATLGAAKHNCTAPVSGPSGACTLDGANMLTVPGIWDLEAKYSGDALYKAATDPDGFTQTVEKATTTIAIIGTSPSGGDTQVTVRLTSRDLTAYDIRYDGTITISDSGPPNKSCTITLSTPVPTPQYDGSCVVNGASGSYQASYSGNANFKASNIAVYPRLAIGNRSHSAGGETPYAAFTSGGQLLSEGNSLSEVALLSIPGLAGFVRRLHPKQRRRAG
jgi:hypothetical protein